MASPIMDSEKKRDRLKLEHRALLIAEKVKVLKKKTPDSSMSVQLYNHKIHHF